MNNRVSFYRENIRRDIPPCERTFFIQSPAVKIYPKFYSVIKVRCRFSGDQIILTHSDFVCRDGNETCL